jgi:hypothetical protein
MARPGSPILHVVVLVCAAIAGPGHALGPGDLDPSFNGGAPLLLDLAQAAPGNTQCFDVKLDQAGRIVVAGDATDPDGKIAVAIARLTASGALDPTFGVGGRRVTQAGRGSGRVFSQLLRALRGG